MSIRKSLYERVRDRSVLLSAWRVIRANAERSGSKASASAAREFEENLFPNIENIQLKLRKHNYEFAKARGVAVRKGKNKVGKRGIVIATLRDRVVQRAILDVVYRYNDAPAIAEVLNTRTSVGGVPKLGIGHALALIEQAVERGAEYIIKSDIQDFFPSLPRANALAFMRRHITDEKFVRLFEQAVTVELENHDDLEEDVTLFPIGTDGIAQGSPLSVLAGNIVLREFDSQLNGRGITCVRYIDDFIILAPTKRSAEKALKNGLKILSDLNLKAYSPHDGTDKASAGPANKPFDFLGYRIVRGLNAPSTAARNKLLEKLEGEFAEGRKQISRCIKYDLAEPKVRQCYVQTLTRIDSILRGWAGAFQYSQSMHSLTALDAKIDQKLAAFETWFGNSVAREPSHLQRRALGIRLLGDTISRPLPSLADE